MLCLVVGARLELSNVGLAYMKSMKTISRNKSCEVAFEDSHCQEF